MEIENVRDLKDMVIMALRYALPRHTYAITQVTDFIMENEKLIDKRVKSVMLNDIAERIDQSTEEDYDLYNSLVIAPTIVEFRDWLKDLEV